jgi:hypothetical protein
MHVTHRVKEIITAAIITKVHTLHNILREKALMMFNFSEVKVYENKRKIVVWVMFISAYFKNR